MDRSTSTYTQMGGEGVPWIGAAPFTNEKHIFANLGDGTYFHSGSLAVRAAVAAKVPITYKILFNDAVAMTGGQPTDGQLTAPQITQQMHAEGVRKIVIVTDEPEKYDRATELDHSAVNAHGAIGDAWKLAPGVTVHHRDELDRIQRELREYPGVSVLVYDQTCVRETLAAQEEFCRADRVPRPARRVVINELVCGKRRRLFGQIELPVGRALETEFGRKRQINQSSCNKDYRASTLCPSFRRSKAASSVRAKAIAASTVPSLPEPDSGSRPALDVWHCDYRRWRHWRRHDRAAAGMRHRRLCGLSVLDMAGLAQKGGAVFSHVQIAPKPEDLFATRIAMGEADLIIGADLIVATSNEALSKIQSGKTRAVVNTSETPTADFVRNPDWQFGGASLGRELRDAIGSDADAAFVDANALATAIMGDAIYTNPFMLGFAWQKGWIPLAHETLLRAIELNAVAVDANKKAFEWALRSARRRGGPQDRLPRCCQQCRRTEALRDLARRHRRSPRRVSDRVPERRLRGAMRTWSSGCGASSPTGFSQRKSRKPSRAAISRCSPTRTSTRSRDCMPIRPSRAHRKPVRGRLQAQLPSRSASAGATGSGNRPDPEDAVRTMDVAGLSHPRETEGTARHSPRHLRLHRGAPQ
jgi:indolepyruvate ferredoxin oxidoreductase